MKLLPFLMHAGACLTQINSLQPAIILLKELEVTVVLIKLASLPLYTPTLYAHSFIEKAKEK